MFKYLISLAATLLMLGCGTTGSTTNVPTDVNTSLEIISSTPIYNATVGEEYSYTINTSGAIITVLPDWLEQVNNVIVGTPSAADVGVSHVAVYSTSADGTDMQEFDIQVTPDEEVVLTDAAFMTLPATTVGYTGGVVPVEFIVKLGEVIDPASLTVVFNRYTAGYSSAYSFGSILIDVTHNVAIIKGDVYIPYNSHDAELTHTITVSYLSGKKEQLLYAFVVKQSNFIPEVVEHTLSVDLTNASSGFTMSVNAEGVVHVNQTLSGLADACNAAGWAWNISASVCIPPEDSPTYDEVLACINNVSSPNKWDFTTGVCYAEVYPDITAYDACVILGGLWDTNTSTCIPN